MKKYFLIFLIVPQIVLGIEVARVDDSIKGNFSWLDQKLSEACEKGKPLIEKAFATRSQKKEVKKILGLMADAGASLRAGRFYNTSIAALPNGEYLLAARITFIDPNELTKMRADEQIIIPGNRARSKFEKGRNFWWINWNDAKFFDGTLFFKSNADFSSVELMIPGFYGKTSKWFCGVDIRLVSQNGKAYVFDSQQYTDEKLPISAEVKVITHKTLGAYFLAFVDGATNINPDKNFAVIDIENINCRYFDWFYAEGLKIVTLDQSAQDEPTKYSECFFPFTTGYAFNGKGSIASDHHNHRHAGVLPLMSFGTPHIKHQEKFIGVGHAKIYVDEEKFPYHQGSNIEKFRAQLNGELKAKLGDQLIRHDAYMGETDEQRSYHYLMYFYYVILDDQNQVVDVKISDAFLPIVKSHTGYQFTLIFPMGLTPDQTNNDDCLITAGYGDYHSVMMKLPIEWIINKCRHSLKQMDFNDFKYYFLEFNSDGSVQQKETVK